jgi:hypothetical protein
VRLAAGLAARHRRDGKRIDPPGWGSGCGHFRRPAAAFLMSLALTRTSYFVTLQGWKVARLFSRLEVRVFRPAVAMLTGTDAVLPFPLRAAVDRVDAQLGGENGSNSWSGLRVYGLGDPKAGSAGPPWASSPPPSPFLRDLRPLPVISTQTRRKCSPLVAFFPRYRACTSQKKGVASLIIT